MAIRKGDGLYFKTGIDNTGLSKGAAQAKGILRTLTKQISGLDLFAGLGIAAGLAFAKISSDAFKLSKDLDLAFREVQTISAATQANFEGMQKAVRDLAKFSPESATKLTKALYQIVSAGYDGAAGLNLLKVSAEAGVAGVTDTQTAADGLTSAMNAWKLEATEATNVADSFFTAVRLGKTTFGELANSISLVAPMASTFGVSLDEVNASVASLTKQGTPTAVAMTQIRQIMISLNETFGQSWRESMTLQEAMEALAKKANDSGKSVKEYTGRIEGAIGIWGLTGDNAKAARKDVEEFTEKMGASADAYRVMQQAAENQIKVLKNRWHDKLIEYGNNIITLFGRFAAAMNHRATIKQLEDEAAAARLAVIDITGLAEGTQVRQQAIENLQLLYPAYFGNLDAEQTSTEDLTDALTLLNEEYAKKIVLEEYSDELAKITKEEDKLKEKRVKHIESLSFLGRNQAGIYEDTYEGLISEWEKLINDPNYEKLRNSLGGGVLLGVQKSIDFLKNYQNELDLLGDKTVKVETLRDRILELVSIDTTVAGSAAAEGLAETLEETWEFEEGGYDAFKKQIQEAQKAYEDWVKYRQTSHKEFIKEELTSYFNRGATYELFLKNQLQAFKGNKEAEAYLIRQLAELEYQQLKETRELMAKFYEEMADKATKELEDAIIAMEKLMDAYIRSIERAVENSLRDEGEQPEPQKIHWRYGKYRFFNDDELEEFDRDVEQYSNLVGQLGDAFERFGARSSAAMDLFGASIKGFTNLAAADKDQFGNITLSGANQILGGVLQVIDAIERYRVSQVTKELEQDAEKIRAHVSGLNHEIDVMNRQLEDHLRLLSELQGVDWLAGAGESVNLMEEQIKQLELSIRAVQLRWVAPKDPTADVDFDRWSDFIAAKIPGGIDNADNETIQKFLDENWEVLLPGPRDQIKAWLDEINALGLDIKDIWSDYKLETIGFDADFITDEILSAFEAAEDGIVDFSKSFQTIMKEALVNTFKQRFLYDAVDDFYQQLYESLDSQARTGEDRFASLTKDELIELQTAWGEIMADAQVGWEAMQQFLEDFGIGDSFEYPEKKGLEGAIKGITEDTANIIAGQFTAMRFNILELTEVAEDQLEVLNQIQLNTTHNSRLIQIQDHLYDISKAVGGTE